MPRGVYTRHPKTKKPAGETKSKRPGAYKMGYISAAGLKDPWGHKGISKGKKRA
jgi:hypothetical protein